jgi:hypothetical protein
MPEQNKILMRERVRQAVRERLTIRWTPKGWLVLQERDGAVTRRVTYDDWHRVERVLWLIELPILSEP